MKIKEIKKVGKRYFITFFSNEEINLHEEVIIKYMLLRAKEIEDETYKNIINDNNFYDGLDIAYQYLKRPRFEMELRNYLEKKEIKNIDLIIKNLKFKKYLDDYLVANNYLNHYIRQKKGPLFIKKFLIDNKVNIDIIEEVLRNYTKENSMIILSHLFKIYLETNSKKAKKKLIYGFINYATNKGFHLEDIKLTIEDMNDLLDNISNEQENLIKEMDKIKKKLEKKYSNDELRNKMISSLIAKGYEYGDIIDNL